ncbi:hypothetical protein BpHYR1_042731 [Brachionus plicatilis]|uniref:Uncharacterized protein n=1 Tax=Brachionus plicatilis TaxID=10195 RepID=A0A3M7QXV9_BRAPC|nr:hypothetical protein BpHYR1_042731 [Brachionus plicatilis]
MVSTFALCLLPLSILDMGPFKDLIHKLNPQFNHVSRTIATRRLLPKKINFFDCEESNNFHFSKCTIKKNLVKSGTNFVKEDPLLDKDNIKKYHFKQTE